MCIGVNQRLVHLASFFVICSLSTDVVIVVEAI